MRRGLKFEGVAVAGIGMVRFATRCATYPLMHMARDAGLLALHDAGMTLADVDEAFVGYITPGSMIGVKAMKELGLTGLPVTHIENASATGLVAFREAAWAVASGRAEVAMALCFDKMTEMGGQRRRVAAAGATRSTRRSCPRRTSRCGRSGACTTTAPPSRRFAAIAAKNWNHGALSPMSHRQPDHVVTVEEVLASRMVARAAHGDDVLPGRRRRRVRDRGHARTWVRRAAAGPPRRAAAGVGAAERVVLAGPHVPRPGGRPGDDDA